MATKANSNLRQTTEMELFALVVAGFRSELRILPNIKMKLFTKKVKN